MSTIPSPHIVVKWCGAAIIMLQPRPWHKADGRERRLSGMKGGQKKRLCEFHYCQKIKDAISITNDMYLYSPTICRLPILVSLGMLNK